MLQGQAPDLLGRLAGRLSRRRELPVPALRPERQGASRDGENIANYENPEYDRLYRELQALDDGPEKQQVIDKMVAHGAAGRAVVASATSRGGGLAFQQWVLQRQAGILIRDMAQVLPASTRSCASPSRPSGTGRPGGRWCCCSRSLVVLVLDRAARLPGARSGRPPRRSAPRRGRRRRSGLTSPMLNYLIRRVGYGVLILIGVNLFTFFLFFTVNTPDDMARLNIGGKRVTQEQIDKWKAERGYDKPLYWNAAGGGRRQAHRDRLLGALGVAVRARLRPLRLGAAAATSATRSSTRMWVSLQLARAAVHPAGDREHGVRAAAGVLPPFAHRLLGRRAVRADAVDLEPVLHHRRPVPVLAHAAAGADLGLRRRARRGASSWCCRSCLSLLARLGTEARLYRAMFLEEIGKDYVRTARAKGLPESIVLFRHVLQQRADPDHHQRRLATCRTCSSAAWCSRASSASPGSAPS